MAIPSRPVKSKRYSLIAIVCVTVLVVGVVWRMGRAPSPTLSFVEFRAGPYGQVAVFRVTNTSDRPFSYLGYGPSMPWFYHRVPTASGFRPESIYDCGTGAGYVELPPHTSRDFEISASHASVPTALGIYFEQATPADIYSRSESPLADLRYLIQRLLPTPDPTWSVASLTNSNGIASPCAAANGSGRR